MTGLENEFDIWWKAFKQNSRSNMIMEPRSFRPIMMSTTRFSCKKQTSLDGGGGAFAADWRAGVTMINDQSPSAGAKQEKLICDSAQSAA